MKAPEKIYLDSYGSGFSHGFHTNKLNDNDIEYTRTDIITKKIEDWFADVENGIVITDVKLFSEDLIEYLKG